jgi:hypothetical protein
MARFVFFGMVGLGIVVLIGLGGLLVVDSYNTTKWATNPPYDPSVFGAGVSVLAVGLALVIAWVERMRK